MGREADVRKARECKHCEKVLHTTADGLKDHTDICKRATAIGLLLAGGIEMP